MRRSAASSASLRALALDDLLLQRRVALRKLGVRLRERQVQRLELARLFRLQRCVRRREALVEPLELAPLPVELDQHLHLAAQDLGHDRHVHVIDRAQLVALEPVEIGHVHRGDEDDRRLLEARMLVDQRRGLEAVHARHVDVEQDRRVIRLHQPRERFRARARVHEVLPEHGQDRVVAHQPRRLVVDEQDVDLVVAGVQRVPR